MIKETIKIINETKYYIFIHDLYFILECYRLQSSKHNSILKKNIALNVKNYIWTLKIYKYVYMSKEYLQKTAKKYVPPTIKAQNTQNRKQNLN